MSAIQQICGFRISTRPKYCSIKHTILKKYITAEYSASWGVLDYDPTGPDEAHSHGIAASRSRRLYPKASCTKTLATHKCQQLWRQRVQYAVQFLNQVRADLLVCYRKIACLNESCHTAQCLQWCTDYTDNPAVQIPVENALAYVTRYVRVSVRSEHLYQPQNGY